MATSNTVTVRFIGDAGPLQKTFKQVGDGAEDTHKRISGMGSKISGVFTSLGAATAAVGIAKFGADSVNAFKDAEQASLRLSQAFSKSPALIGANVKEFENLAAVLQKKTKFDDEAIKSGEAVLAGFNLTGDQIKELTPLLLDYASRTGKTVPDAATDLGKALLGQARALKAIGIDFKDTGSTAGNFAELVGGLREKVGGLATKEGKSASGQMAILKNQFGELQEKVGSALVPILTKLASIVLSVVEFFQHLPGPIQIIVVAAAGLAIGLVALSAVFSAVGTVAAAFGVIMTVALGPIGLIILAIAALAAAAYLVFKNWDTIVTFFSGLWDTVYGVFRDAVDAVIGWVRDHWPIVVGILTGGIGFAVAMIIRHWDDIVSFIGGIPGRLASIGSTMWDWMIDAFKGAINWIIRAWNNLDFEIPGFNFGPVHFGGFTLGMPDIPELAQGGIIKRPTLAMVGERGPEAVVPLSRLNGMGSPTFNFPNYVGDKRELEDFMVRILARNGYRNGGTGIRS